MGHAGAPGKPFHHHARDDVLGQLKVAHVAANGEDPLKRKHQLTSAIAMQDARETVVNTQRCALDPFEAFLPISSGGVVSSLSETQWSCALCRPTLSAVADEWTKPPDPVVPLLALPDRMPAPAPAAAPAAVAASCTRAWVDKSGICKRVSFLVTKQEVQRLNGSPPTLQIIWIAHCELKFAEVAPRLAIVASANERALYIRISSSQR